MKPVKNLGEAVTPMYLGSIAIRIAITGSPIKRLMFLGFGFDRALARHLPLGNPSHYLWRTEVHRV